MKVNELINHWQHDLPSDDPPTQISINLPIIDAARINALSEMYPQQTTAQIISGLVSSTLVELQAEINQLNKKNNGR